VLDEWEWEYDYAWLARSLWEEYEARWGELIEIRKRPLKGGACITEVREHVEVEVCASLQDYAQIETFERRKTGEERLEEVRIHEGGEAFVHCYLVGASTVETEWKAWTPLSPLEAVKRIFKELASNYRNKGQYYTPYVAWKLQEILSLRPQG
jgi:hypothetical protein